MKHVLNFAKRILQLLFHSMLFILPCYKDIYKVVYLGLYVDQIDVYKSNAFTMLKVKSINHCKVVNFETCLITICVLIRNTLLPECGKPSVLMLEKHGVVCQI